MCRRVQAQRVSVPVTPALFPPGEAPPARNTCIMEVCGCTKWGLVGSGSLGSSLCWQFQEGSWRQELEGRTAGTSLCQVDRDPCKHWRRPPGGAGEEGLGLGRAETSGPEEESQPWSSSHSVLGQGRKAPGNMHLEVREAGNSPRTMSTERAPGLLKNPGWK